VALTIPTTSGSLRGARSCGTAATPGSPAVHGVEPDDDPLELRALDGLALEQLLRQLVEDVQVGEECRLGDRVRFFEERADFAVDELRGLLAEFRVLDPIPPEEHLGVVVAQHDGPIAALMPYSVTIARAIRVAFLRSSDAPGRELLHRDLFGRAPTHEDREARAHLLVRHAEAILVGHEVRDAEGAARAGRS
jgi:hypothetical protein